MAPSSRGSSYIRTEPSPRVSSCIDPHYQSVNQYELDICPSTTSADPISKTSPKSAALSSTVRRRAKPPKPLRIGSMSLVALKHIFFRQSISSTSTLSSSENGLTTNDVESQNSSSQGKKDTENKSWKLDARVISDATIGLSDGLTVPFALTAGLSALGNTKVVIYGGLAELIAGAISMGLGGYLGAKSEAASYEANRDEAQQFIVTNPRAVIADIKGVFEPYKLPKSTLDELAIHLVQSPKLVDFVMQFRHCAEEPAASRAFTSALTIALGYFLGGLLPLIPYFCVRSDQLYTGLYISVGVMVVALFVFGYVKTCIVIGWRGGKNIRRGCYGGLQMTVVGSFAAGAAMGLVRAFNHNVNAGCSA